MPSTLPRVDINSEIVNAGVVTSRLVVGIVPVLTVTPENVSVPTPRSREEARFPLGETPGSLRSGYTGSALLSSPKKNRESGLQSLGTTAQQSLFVASDRSYNVLQVSLSVVKRCCVSLLHSLLEQHDVLESVSAAFASRDFKLAAQHVAVVIEAQRIVAKNRRDECKNMADSWRSSLSWVHPHSHGRDSDVSRKTDDALVEENTRFTRFMKRCGESSSCVEPQQYVSIDRKGKEIQQGGGGGESRQSSGEELPSAESEEGESLEIDKLRALKVLWNANSAQQELAPLYALLSLVHFHDAQYQQSLEDAITALAHDDTCVEAYTRVMASFMALSSEQEAFVASSLAIRRCSVISPQFVRLSRILCACAFYRRNLAEHSGIDVLPRVRHSSCLEKGPGGEPAKIPKIQRSVRLSSTFRVQKLCYSCTAPTSLFSAVPLALRVLRTGACPPMDYFSRSLRARALCGFNHGDLVVCEKPSLHVLLLCSTKLDRGATALLSSLSSSPWCEDGSCPATVWTLCRKRFCAYCGYPLVSKQVLMVEIREAASKALADRLCRNFSAREPLPCAAGCGDHYCSEVCRNRAAVEYHSIECQVVVPYDDDDDDHVVGEEEEEPSPLNPAASQEFPGEPAASASSLFSSGAVDRYARLVELCPSATVPFDRPSVRGLVAIRRRRMYGGGSECRLESADVQHSEPQRDSDMSSDDTLIAAEQDKRYASSIETCRTAIRSVRAAFKCHYAAVEKAIHDKAPYAITAALLVLSRLVANILSLLLPPAAREVKGFTEPDYCCRERSTSIKAIIGRYALRGFTSYGTAPSDHHDAHGLALAEEVLHQIGVPFFADTNLAQPTTVWELLDDEPREAKKNGDEALPAVTSTTQNIRRGFDRAVGLLSAINKIIRTSLRDEAVAFSLSVSPNAAQSLASDSSGRFSRMWASKHSDEPMTESCSSGHRATRHPKLFMDGGSLLVWLAEEHGEFRSDMLHNPSVWTFGRLLGFLGKRRFMEQLWDFCL
ncbi:hypothetical protein LSM04_001899, partial [Trypanosoma melophagium]|uniref:uncharacterized protein n=1 Tax=Trypanosoma melophagium TaxID=715481 RepID=UPI00351A2CF6